jgi:hypothetical protein
MDNPPKSLWGKWRQIDPPSRQGPCARMWGERNIQENNSKSPQSCSSFRARTTAEKTTILLCGKGPTIHSGIHKINGLWRWSQHPQTYYQTELREILGENEVRSFCSPNTGSEEAAPPKTLRIASDEKDRKDIFTYSRSCELATASGRSRARC